MALEICVISLHRLASRAFCLALFKVTKTIVAKIPIMAITTKSSIKVNPVRNLLRLLVSCPVNNLFFGISNGVKPLLFILIF